MMTKQKRYTVECPAVFVYDVIATNRKDALIEAKEEFYGLLRFLSKATEGAAVVGLVARNSKITDVSEEDI